MKGFLNIALAALLALVAGCATPVNHTDTAQTSGPTAVCHVCRYNNDLACLCVKVRDNTPKTEYQSTTYYFCSEECKAAFVKKPERYLSQQ